MVLTLDFLISVFVVCRKYHIEICFHRYLCKHIRGTHTDAATGYRTLFIRNIFYVLHSEHIVVAFEKFCFLALLNRLDIIYSNIIFPTIIYIYIVQRQLYTHLCILNTSVFICCDSVNNILACTKSENGHKPDF